ncbi:AfsR/SARP family transcriptional regulator [Microbispora sp. CA-135349]|uniref:AfsR/SARP family transcriptional regulator n=1 Tax=Microbispora sp. CA-135349 TaxID=3239953 RepID=UPI003D90461C
MSMEFRLLGDFEVLFDGRHVEIGHARQRCVLATLLAEAGRCVPVDELLDHVRAGRPPVRGRETLYIDPLTVDAHRFRLWVNEARGKDDVAAQRLLEKRSACGGVTPSPVSTRHG